MSQKYNLTPYEPAIDPQNPYKEDKCGFKSFGDVLTNVLSSSTEGTVVAVDAPWGEGKSTFAKMWTADLKKEKKLSNVIVFDAFRHDGHTDPFVPLAAEILALIKPLDNTAYDNLKKASGALLKSVGKAIPGAALKVFTLGVVDGKMTEGFAEAMEESAETFAESLIDNYHKDKSVLEEFSRILSEAAEKHLKEKNFPLLVVVDELDRCKPDFALLLIERMKHLFACNGVSFVLLTNMKQMARYVRKEYGDDVSSEEYLRKFFTVTLALPHRVSGSIEKEPHEYVSALLSHYGINRNLNEKRLTAWFDFFDCTMRESDRCCLNIALVFSSFIENPTFLWADLICFFVILKHKFPFGFEKFYVPQFQYDGLDHFFSEICQHPSPSFKHSRHQHFLNFEEFDFALKYLTNESVDYVGNGNPLLDSDMTTSGYRRRIVDDILRYVNLIPPR